MWGVPLSAGLPCDARAEVVPENSLRGLTAASFKQLRQVCQRCALRAPTSTLCFSAPTRRPASSSAQTLWRPAWWHATSPRPRHATSGAKKSRVGGWRGACVGVAGTQAGPGLPLASGKGMASMFEAAGRVAQPPGPDQCRRAVPLRGTAHMKPCQPPTRRRPALPRKNAPYPNTTAIASATRSTLLTFSPAAHIRPERNTYTPCVSRSTSACAALKPV